MYVFYGDYMEVVVLGCGELGMCSLLLCVLFLLCMVVSGGVIGCEGLMV